MRLLPDPVAAIDACLHGLEAQPGNIDIHFVMSMLYLRLGWIECAPSLMARLAQDGVLISGGAMSPFTAWLLLKGLETLDLRVRAQAIEDFLEIPGNPRDRR